MTLSLLPSPDRRGTDSLKWAMYGPDVLPLWVADMDFPSPEPVLEALRERVNEGVLGYPDLTLTPEGGADGFRATLVDRMARLYGWKIQPEEIIFVPGVVTGFNLACHTLGGPGDALLIQPPVYMPFLVAAQHVGMERKDATLVQDASGHYGIDWEAFEAGLQGNTKAFLLCHPHNPVGRAWRQDELRRMADLCLKHGVTMISDEIHCDLLFDGHRHTPLAALDPEIARHTITIMAPSKTFNIAGLACSFAIIQDAALRQRYLQARRGLVSAVNLLGLTAGEACYRHGQPWLDQLLATLDHRRRLLADLVARDLPGVSMQLPEATYLAWLDCREANLPGNPAAFFLDEAKVALNDGEAFGPGGKGFVRLNFGCSEALLREAVGRMAEALKRR